MTDIQDNEEVRVGDIVSALSGLGSKTSYPSEAVPLGTFVRSLRYNKVGIVIDAYYEYTYMNEEEQKVVIYTLLLPPSGFIADPNDQFIITQESEYDTICFLLLQPVKIRKILKSLNQGNTL